MHILTIPVPVACTSTGCVSLRTPRKGCSTLSARATHTDFPQSSQHPRDKALLMGLSKRLQHCQSDCNTDKMTVPLTSTLTAEILGDCSCERTSIGTMLSVGGGKRQHAAARRGCCLATSCGLLVSLAAPGQGNAAAPGLTSHGTAPSVIITESHRGTRPPAASA